MLSDNLIYGILIFFAFVSAVICGPLIYQGSIIIGIFFGFFAILLAAVVIFCKIKKGKRNENKS